MNDYKLFRCIQCGFEYDEEKGRPQEASSQATAAGGHPRGSGPARTAAQPNPISSWKRLCAPDRVRTPA